MIDMMKLRRSMLVATATWRCWLFSEHPICLILHINYFDRLQWRLRSSPFHYKLLCAVLLTCFVLFSIDTDCAITPCWSRQLLLFQTEQQLGRRKPTSAVDEAWWRTERFIVGTRDSETMQQSDMWTRRDASLWNILQWTVLYDRPAPKY